MIETSSQKEHKQTRSIIKTNRTNIVKVFFIFEVSSELSSTSKLLPGFTYITRECGLVYG